MLRCLLTIYMHSRNWTLIFFEYEVIDGRLFQVFLADTTSKKNYDYFGDVLSFDTTYNTNQYDMKFTPFTGVNHHMCSIFFGADRMRRLKAMFGYFRFGEGMHQH
jgi:hypothetical protein